MNNEQTKSHAEEAQNLWEESEKLEFIRGLKAGKSVAEIMSQLDTAEAFAEKSEVAGCSDGRICDEDEHRLGTAGNGILLFFDSMFDKSKDQTKLEKFILANKGKIKKVKSHDHCGAAKIKFDLMQAAGEKLPEGVNTSDELGIYYSQELARRLGAEYEHTKMLNTMHNERAIYLDGTGKFNPSALPELPAGFMCSGPDLGFNPKDQEVELVTLAKIPLGDHGFGERFDKDNPFYIVVSANNQKQLDELKEIAERAASQFNGKIKVDGFIVE